MNQPYLDGRVWLLWLVSISAIPLLSRNPILIAEVLIITWVVRLSWQANQGKGLGWLLRLACGFALLGVIFNSLTVHAGDQVLFSLPEGWPVIGGGITLNAVVYGLCSALALVTLVLASMTIGEIVDWVELLGHLPRSLSGVAVACSVAWMFLPQVGTSFRQLREAQLLRGEPANTFRSMAPLIVPLLGGALERALMTAEAMEARGYGTSLEAAHQRSGLSGRGLLVLGSLLSFLLAGFGLGVGNGLFAACALTVGLLLGGVGLRLGSGTSTGPTRLLAITWSRTDRIVASVLTIALLLILVWRTTHANAFRFEPYPDLIFPPVDPWLMAWIALLLVPAVIPAWNTESP